MSASTLGKLALQERTRREILHKSDLIPPLPDVVVKVIALLNQGDSEPEQLEEHLRCDQVLVAKMLALVNSPFYGFNREIKGIREAIMVLGFRGLRSLVLASGTADYMKLDYSCYGHSSKGLWQHSLAVASGARALARPCGLDVDQQEELFISGLLHDIGKMLVSPYLIERRIRRSDSQMSIHELERDALGVDHTEAGALVSAKWNLSTTVQEILKLHHDSEVDPEHTSISDDLRRFHAILRISESLAHRRGTGYAPDLTPTPEPIDKHLQLLGIGPAEWASLENSIGDAVEASLASMDKLCT